TAAVVAHTAEEEVHVGHGGSDVVLSPQCRARLGERARGQAIPGRQDLVVTPRMNSPLADLVERPPSGCYLLVGPLPRQPQDVGAALEVRAAVHAPVGEREIGSRTERRPNFTGGPDEELALVALG